MRYLLFVAIILMAGVSSVDAIVLGQMDDFQNGTPQGWYGGYEVSVVNVASGGPGGSADRYLMASSQANEPNVRYSLDNFDQWRGNYATAKVSMIEMDLRNTNPMALEVCIMIEAANYGDFASFQAVTLPPDCQWYHVSFSLLEKDLIWGGQAKGDYDGAMRHVDWFSIEYLADAGISYDPPVFVKLDIDNIHALPEPSSCMTVLLLSLIGQRLIARRAHSPACREKA